MGQNGTNSPLPALNCWKRSIIRVAMCHRTASVVGGNFVAFEQGKAAVRDHLVVGRAAFEIRRNIHRIQTDDEAADGCRAAPGANGIVVAKGLFRIFFFEALQFVLTIWNKAVTWPPFPSAEFKKLSRLEARGEVTKSIL